MVFENALVLLDLQDSEANWNSIADGVEGKKGMRIVSRPRG